MIALPSPLAAWRATNTPIERRELPTFKTSRLMSIKGILAGPAGKTSKE